VATGLEGKVSHRYVPPATQRLASGMVVLEELNLIVYSGHQKMAGMLVEDGLRRPY